MNFKKTVAIAAAAGALAAVSVPAMALENEFHGIYNLKFFGSNYENGGSKAIDPTAYRNGNKINNYFEQRARIMYIAKASDDLKLVTQFELDSKFGGDKTGKYAGSSDAGTFDADGISLETKHVYLDFNLGKDVKLKTGIQPIKDSLKGVFVDVDAAGIQAASKFGSATVTGGYYRMATESSNAAAAPAWTTQKLATTTYFSNTAPIGHYNTDLFMLDGKYAINKDTNVGASYYLFSDYSTVNPITIHVLGLNADAKIGAATVSGFVAAETGYYHEQADPSENASISGYAVNVAAKLPVGPGTLKTAALFLTGDGTDNKNSTTWFSTGGATYAEGGMFLLARTGAGGTNTDRTITGPAMNSDKGTILYTLGYDATITPKLYANANLGMLWVAKSATAPINRNTGNANGGDMVGTEVNLETGYKVYDNLTAKVQLAYVILGGAYKSSALNETNVVNPENPYTARVGLSYAF